jgi:hypothetical protein
MSALARGRDDLDLGRESFEERSRGIEIMRKTPTSEHRVLYVMQRRS